MTYDSAENGWGRVASVTVTGFTEGYGYTAGGLVKKKSVVVSGTQKALVAEWTYDNEGRRTSLKYPDLYNWAQYPEDATVREVGKKVNFLYDTAGRWSGVQDALSLQMLASNAAYNPAGQLTGVSLQYGSDQYTFNTRGQLTREQHPGGVDITYGYSATANDGRVISKTDGTTVQYEYDELGRLSKAETTGAGWGLSWVYDGFGNRLQQNLIKGTAPAPVVTVDAATNRITSQYFSYDANGNMTQWPQGGGTATGTFDVENRMVGVVSGSVSESYVYNAANQRVLLQRGTNSPQVFFYGLEGELLGTYTHLGFTFSSVETRVYFRGRRLKDGWSDDSEDRLGSVRWQQRGQQTRTFNYFPYGEQMGGSSYEDLRKFGTYTRDSASGLDFAWNRYYSATWGRFTTRDPLLRSARLGAPQSWNRYSYVSGDPVNSNDPTGLFNESSFCDVYPSSAECNHFGFPGGSDGLEEVADPLASEGSLPDGISNALSGLGTIAKGDFKNKAKCKEFFEALVKGGGLTMDADSLMGAVLKAASAGYQHSTIYDGPSASTVALTTSAFGNSNADGARTVAEWFDQHQLAEGLSQKNGTAIFIVESQWSTYGGSMAGFFDGNPTKYGLGTLMHEILHKSSLAGGFSHSQMDDALNAINAPSRQLGQGVSQSSRIGQICF